MTERTYLVTVEAAISISDQTRPLTDVLRSAHLRNGANIQDVDSIEWTDASNAVALLSLTIPVDEDVNIEDCENTVREGVMGEQYTICKGTMEITKVFEVIPFEEEF